MKIKTLIGTTLALAFAAVAPHAAAADDFPQRPIRLIVGFSAGSISDVAARLVADQAAKTLGQPITIEDVPGAGSTIAAARVAKAAPDGHTLLFTSIGHVLAPSLYSKLSYDAVKDFAGVATIADTRVMLVTQPGNNFKTVVDFIAAAKADPGKYTFGSSGAGTYLQLVGESMAQAAGIKMLNVPYRGGPEAITAVMSGDVDLAFCTVNACIESVNAGKLKPLGYVSTARHPALLNVPTFKELGVDLDVSSYNFILAPAGTPDAVVQKLHTVFNGIVIAPATKERFLSMGLDPKPSDSPQAVTAFVKAEEQRWSANLRSMGMKAE
jgi:tripartite-type tricarboxylate transporter receptor subunit TctC